MTEVPTVSTFELQVVSAQGLLYSGRVRQVSATSVMGELGILPNHTPLLTQLKPGELRLRTARDEEEYIYVAGGVMEVQPFLVTVLADAGQRGERIDREAALAAKAQAEEAMAAANLYSDRDRARLELLKALAQLRTFEHAKRRTKR